MAVGASDYSIYPKDIKKLLVSEIQSILFLYSFSEKAPYFMRVPRGYRRNGISPMKGIDT